MCIYPAKKYCVYLTTYLGNKFPPFYIGSSSIDKIEKGYRGTVASKKYKKLFCQELKNNPQLFKTQIVATYHSRKMALYREKILQIKLNVVKSTMYINQSIAQLNGCHGMSVRGEDSPVYGRKCSRLERYANSLRIKEAWKNTNSGYHSPDFKTKKIQTNGKKRRYLVVRPDGKKIVVNRLRDFCRENGLTHVLMLAVAKGQQTHHKKHTCEYIL